MGKAKMKKHSPRSTAAGPGVLDCGKDVSTSAEERLLQSSLAKLDARLSSLAARCTGKSLHALTTGMMIADMMIAGTSVFAFHQGASKGILP